MTEQIGLIPLINFATVDNEKNLHRSAQPLYNYQYNWLRNKLHVEHIVNLRSESKFDEQVAPNFGIKVTTIPVKDHFPPTIEQAKEFMELVKNNENILFHCEHGQGRTSLFCVLARIAQGQTLEQALNEEKDIYGYEFKHPIQLEFLQTNFSNLKN